MLKAIADRRAVRNFTDQPVEEEKLHKIKEALGIPANGRVVSLVPVGYAAQPPAPQRRRDMADVVVAERWQ